MSIPIAIVGMGCRFAGSRDLTAYWRTVRDGRTCFGDVPQDRWSLDTFHDPSPRSPDHTYSRAFGAIDDVRSFSPKAFGISLARARQMDPQQRLFLDVTRCALEDAGYVGGGPRADRTGVFLGISTCEHRDYISARLRLMQMLDGDFGEVGQEIANQAERLVSFVPRIQPSALIGQMLNMAATNIAQAFRFRGPAYAVDSACSSALVAVHNAMAHLRAGECDVAVVGGVYLNFTPDNFIGFSKLGALSKTGVCRPLDAAADGFVLGEGAGAVVLRRLGDAVRDGESVWAVLRGAAMSNDGAEGGPLRPSVEGQASAIEQAYLDAEADPGSVGFVEIHGTGTPVGDTVEVSALRRTMGEGSVECFLSSAKANVGHTLAAAGAASLIRATLATAYGVRPPQAAFTELSGKLGLENSRFRVSPRRVAWPSNGSLRRAGVSSFGFGGTNVHLAIEEAPAAVSRPVGGRTDTGTRKAVWVTVGAPTRDILRRHVLEIRDALDESDRDSPSCIAQTLARRPSGEARLSVLASDIPELRERLQAVGRRLSGDQTASDVPWLREGSACEEVAPTGLDSGNLYPLPPSPVEDKPFWALAEGSRGRRGGEEGTVLKRIEAIVAEVAAASPKRISRESLLGADLGLDSLAQTELAEALEREFPGTEAARRSLAGDLTIGDLSNLVESAIRGVRELKAPARDFDRSIVEISRTDPRLAEHCIDGVPTLPLAAALDIVLTESGCDAIYDWKALRPIQPRGESLRLEVASSSSGVTLRSGSPEESPCASCRVGPAGEPPESLPELAPGEPPSLALERFYNRDLFHGAPLRAVLRVEEVGPRHAIGQLRRGSGLLAGKRLDWLAFDGALQLCAYWARSRTGRTLLPTGFDSLHVLAVPPAQGSFRCIAALAEMEDGPYTADIDLLDEDGAPVLRLRGLRGQLMHGQSHQGERMGIESWPEVAALEERFEEGRALGLADPYFRAREGRSSTVKRIAGRDYVDFTSYNYLGLADDPEVLRAAREAVDRYGTSASASRIASGEMVVHRELECAIAEFLGCDDALAMVSGHATNVSVLGRLLGPEDLAVHDSLIHDSILAGVRQAGALRRSFPHNDMGGLDRVLRENRRKARRALVAVEGVYSMDGDLTPLDEAVRIGRRHDALTYVDEAHSIGVVGETGRGVGERYGVDRRSVDLWMGTLSKSLASCGGFVAGSKEAIRYLRYTTPGFIYSVGISPANTAAALAALRKLQREPERVALLQRNARRFLGLCRERGLPVGSASDSAVVPCIVGGTMDALRLSQTLFERGINVQPIVTPAVDEGQARLRFFVTSQHEEEQLLRAADALAEEFARLRTPNRPAEVERSTATRREAI